MWNGTMFVDLDWPLNASSLLSASAELLVTGAWEQIRPLFKGSHVLTKVGSTFTGAWE